MFRSRSGEEGEPAPIDLKTLHRRPEIFPLFLAIFPILALAANNAREIVIADAVRPLLIAVLGTSLVYLILRGLRGGPYRSALATAWVTLLFFSYGHVYAVLKQVQWAGEPIGRHRYLAPLAFAVTILLFWVVFRRFKSLSSVTPMLNLVALVLVIFPAFRLLAPALQALSEPNRLPAQLADTVELSAPEDSALPDIYYIILDSYGRSDVLEETYGYDNSEFLNDLENLGFYIATDSASNYSYTILSLASSLNYSYLHELGIGLDPSRSASDWHSLNSMIKDSQVRRDLSSLGYQMIAIETGYRPTTIDNADVYLSRDVQGPFAALSAITPLETLLLETTALKILVDARTVAAEFISPYARHREMILFQLESLKQIPDLQRPTFTFAHIMAPHEPYVFGPNGEPRTPNEVFSLGNHDAPDSDGTDREGYVDQAIFIEDQIVEVVKEILQASAEPPIIILQGDHGLPISDVSASERMAILNVYYLPPEARRGAYPQISPVNSFRLVLSSVFNAEITLLDDEAYFSRYPDLFNTTPIEAP